MSQAADPNSRALGVCDGGRPWLGQGRVADERCNERNRLLVRAASNAWLPQPQRVISLPERGENIRQTIDKLWMFLEAAESADDIAYERRKPKVNEGLAGLTNEEVWEAVRERKNPLDSAEKPVKRAEIETLLALGDQIGEDTLESTFFARVLPIAEWNQPWMAGIERVLLVERLREVAALVGFTRLESASADAETGELDAGVRRAEISRQPEWVPAVENRGGRDFSTVQSRSIVGVVAAACRGESVCRTQTRFRRLEKGTQFQRPEAADAGVSVAAFVFTSADYCGRFGVQVSGELDHGASLRGSTGWVWSAAVHREFGCGGDAGRSGAGGPTDRGFRA